MRTHLSDQETRKKGFTLMELIVVIAIIAILCAIGIPSIVAINKTLKFKQANDYAESIFMAAQSNLTQLHSEGKLGKVQTAGGSWHPSAKPAEVPSEDWNDDFRFTVTGREAYNRLLPGSVIDETVRSKNVLIEYNPVTGNVYSVFYSGDESWNLKNDYDTDSLKRDERWRRKHFLGYYQGSDIPTKEIRQQETDTVIRFENGQEGIVKVNVIIPTSYLEQEGQSNGGKQSAFMQGLSVKLTVKGQLTKQLREAVPGAAPLEEKDYSFVVPARELIKKGIDNDPERGTCVSFVYSIDSLRTGESFASHSYFAVDESTGEKVHPEGQILLTGITDENSMKILPGDNVDLEAEVTFDPPKGYQPVAVKNGSLSGVNPVFEYLTESGEQNGKYTIGLKNGRNLQNLNIISPSIAKLVQSIHFTEEKLNWNETVSYYNVHHPSKNELPGRALPYFVPVYQKDLFGSLNDPLGVSPKEEKGNKKQEARKPATIHGKSDSEKGTEIYYLNIDAELYNSRSANFYATEGQTLNYARFTGLFSYVNTRIDNLKIVNPIIKGSNQKGTGVQTATGALFGAGNGNTTITNCAVYLDTKDVKNAKKLEAGGFDRALMAQERYDANHPEKPQTWYGVSGYGAVGGLAGYCYNSRVTNESLQKNLDELSFYKSFAAVAVSGSMNMSTVDGSFPSGIGGFIGTSAQANAYSCYASGNVFAEGCLLTLPEEDEFLDDDTKITVLVPKKDKHGNIVKDKNGNIVYVTKKIELEDYTEDLLNEHKGKGDAYDKLLDIGLALDDDDDGLADDDCDLDDLWQFFLGYTFQPTCNGLTSRGAGGFAGTSQGTRYASCFATGNVQFWNGQKTPSFIYGDDGEMERLEDQKELEALYEKLNSPDHPLKQKYPDLNMKMSEYENYSKYAMGAGSFVGVMCFDGPESNQTALFEDCYALGFALNGDAADDPGRELFAGAVGMAKDPSALLAQSMTGIKWGELPVPMYASDYYRLLAPFFGQTKKRPAYGSLYFFKDTYQYAREAKAIDSTSNECAVFLSRDELVDLLGNQHNAGWQKTRVEETIMQYNAGRYSDFFKQFKGNPNELAAQYYKDYQKGFALGWEKAVKDDNKTHPYNEDKELNKVPYPFAKLIDLDYYGDWPDEIRDAGLAYYEIYNDGRCGIFFDRDGAAVGGLKNGRVVVRDGYAVLSQNSETMSMTVNGKTKNLKLHNEKYRPGGTFGSAAYNVFVIPEADLKMANEKEFYTKLSLNNVVAYYNPNVALSQINAPFGKNEPAKPAGLPGQIIIRSARQFNKVSTMKYFWNENCHYYQQLDIDALLYNWNGVWDGTMRAKCLRSDPIGTRDNPFSGTYTSQANSPAAIRGFRPAGNTVDAGIFGNVGSTGEISNLIVELGLSGNTAIGESAENFGFVVGSSDGLLENITVKLNTDGRVAPSNPSKASKANEKASYLTWESGENYSVGTKVIYDGNVYECLEAHKSKTRNRPDKNDGHWQQVVSTEPDTGKPETKPDTGKPETKPDITPNIPNGAYKDDWDDYSSFKKGDIVEEDDKVYQCIKDHKRSEDKKPGEGDHWKEYWKEMTEEVEVPSVPPKFPPVDPEVRPVGPADLTLTAKNNVGALVGKSTGRVVGCTVNTAGSAEGEIVNLSLSAENAGVMIGLTEKANDAAETSVEYGNVQLGGSLKLTGTDCGGFVGKAKNVPFNNVALDFGNSTADHSFVSVATQTTGGFAGSIDGGSADVISADFACSVDGGSVFGGLAGKASNLTGNALTTVFNMPVTAVKAAGLMETAEHVSLIGCDAAIYAPFEASDLAAGMFGTVSSDSFVDTADVHLSLGYLKSNNSQAAGFAVNAGGSINRANVLLAEQYTDAAKISGATDAAGFAIHTSAQMTDCSVSGMGKISGVAGQAAGFACDLSGEGNAMLCSVTPVLNDGSHAYGGNGLQNLQIIGKTTASGFINTVNTSSEFKSNAGVYNSWALGTIQAEKAAGFAETNQGKIEKCMANIAISGGHAFTASNEGKVTACYGWYTDGETPETMTTVWGEGNSPVSSYFGDIKCNNGDKSITVYDYDGNAETSSSTRIIFDKKVLEKLNKPGAAVTYWQARKYFDAYPFDINLGTEYPYPMLREHYGDWAEGPAHSFGVVYYEIYETKTGEDVYWIHSRDIYNGSNGVEEHKLDYKNFFKKVPINPDNPAEGSKIVLIGGAGDIGKPILVKQNGADIVVDDISGNNLQSEPYNILPDKDIKKTGYAVFCKNTKSGIPVVPFEDSRLIYDPAKNPSCQRNEDLVNVEVPDAVGDYAFYNLLQSGPITIKDKDNKNTLLEFNTWFGDTLDADAKNKPYEIRAAEHFQNIKLTANSKNTVLGNFKQTWDILNQNNNNPGFQTIESFNGVYDGNDRKIVVGNGDQSWIGRIPTWKEDHQGQDDADHEVIRNGLNIEVQKEISQPIFGTEINQAVHINSITAGSVKVRDDSGAIAGAASGSFYCDGNITIRGDSQGPLFSSVSGHGLTIGGILVGREMRLGNPVYGCLAYSVAGDASINIGKIQIGILSNQMFAVLGAANPVKIDSILLGQVNKGGMIINRAPGKFVTPYPSVRPILLNKPNGDPSEEMSTGKMNHQPYPHPGGIDFITTEEPPFIQVANVPLFESVQNYSLQNFNVQIAEANLRAEQGSSAGVLANTMSASVVDNCSIEVGQINVSGNGSFGTVTGVADGNTDIKNTTVKTKIMKTAEAPAVSNGEAASAVIGGIVGENKDSKITNCTVEDLSLTLDGTKDVNTTAGGLVGINEGKLSGNTVKNADVTYVQPAVSGDSAQIGGLVGQMNGGSMENDTVSGKILIQKAEAQDTGAEAGIMTADLSMRDYSVGGAVGAESTETLKQSAAGIAAEEAAPADYMGVNSSVVIANEWTDPEYVIPDDLTSVGMFVGYVEDGIFDSCSSTAEDNQKFGFLGDIKVESKTTPVDAFAQKASDAGNFLSLDAEENLEESLTAVGKKNYDEYSAVLSDCSFHQNGQDFQQTIETHEFFYQKKEAKANQPESLTPVSAVISQKNDLMLKDLAEADTEGAFVPTFFYGNAEDGSLQRLAVLMMVNDDVYTYELAFMDGTPYDVMEVTGAELESAVWNSLPVYTFTHNLTDGAKYLILDEQDQMLAVSQSGELAWEPKAESLEKIEERMLWIASRKNVDSVSWQNVSNDAYFLSKDLTALAGNHALEFQISQDSSIRLGTCEKTLKLIQVNVTAGQTEKGYESIGSSQTLITRKLDENGDPIIESAVKAEASNKLVANETTEATTEAVTETAAGETTESKNEITAETSAANQAAEAPEGNESAAETTEAASIEATPDSATEPAA